MIQKIFRYARAFIACAAIATSTIALPVAGELDPTFNPGGAFPPGVAGERTTSTGEPASGAFGVALQADGKIVTAGFSSTSAIVTPGITASEIALVRYNADGSPDLTFGGTSIVITPIGQVALANAVAIQPADQKIVIAGGQSAIAGSALSILIARYVPAGTLDPAFGGGAGFVTTPLNAGAQANGLALQTDGKIVAAGTTTIAGTIRQIFVARYLSDGSLDLPFGGAGTGIATLPLPLGVSNDQGNDIALQSDGKIVVTGARTLVSGIVEFITARFNTNGTLDTTTFNAGGAQPGVVTTSINGIGDTANSVAIQADGSIVAAGVTTTLALPLTRFAMARYTSTGALDSSFGGGTGIVTTPIGNASAINDVAIQPDGKIVAGGFANIIVGLDTITEFALARYNTNGSLDTGATFGPDGSGIVTTQIDNAAVINSILLQPCRQIVAAGLSSPISVAPLNATQFAVARYQGDNNPPVANNTSAVTSVGVPIIVNLSGSDPDGDSLTFSIVSGPTNGTLSAITQTSPTTAQVTYTPNPGYIGPDSFTYTVTDCAGATAASTATASLTVNAAPSAQPIANPTSATTQTNLPVTVHLSGSDSGGNPLTFSIVSGPSNGTLGSITQTSPTTADVVYSPNLNFAGVDSFTFKVNNGTLDSDPALVTITVSSTPAAPVAFSQTLAVKKNTPKLITLTGFDPNGLPLTFSIVTDPTNGTLGTILQTSPTTAQIIYTPTTGFTGTDEFTFLVNNGILNSIPATISLVILQNTNPLVDAIVAKYC